MLKVLDIFPIGDMLSVTLEGACTELKNGSILLDNNGNSFEIISVAMTRHNNPSDISTSTTVLIRSAELSKGAELSIA